MSAPAATAPAATGPASGRHPTAPAGTGTGRSPRSVLAGRHRLGFVAAAATLLASAPLAAIYEGWSWLFHAAMAVVAVAGAGAAARALRAPLWAQLLAMLGGLLLMLTWLFRSGEELLGLLPTVATLEHFAILLNQLPSEVRHQALPVPGLDPFLLATALGVGLVAIMVDLCAVGLRRPALAGLPMLAVYSVPVAVMFTSVPAITFVIGVVGYLWLLAADSMDRVRRFGRRFTGDGRDVDAWEPSPLAAAGRRLAVIGLLAAVLVPVAIPGVTTGLVDRLGSGFAGMGGSGNGGSPAAVNLFAALDGLLNRDETIEMMEVTTTDPDPAYLRIGVADQITAEGFDHRRPRGAPVTSGILQPTRPDGVTHYLHEAQVRILSGYSMPRLPIYPELFGLGVDDNWRYDPEQQVVFSADGGAEGLEYPFTYARREFDPDALRNRGGPPPAGHDVNQLAEIPDQLRESQVSALVSELTGDLDNPYDQVLAIHGYFSTRNGFTYSLETGDATTGSAIVDFLFENKRGYCVQYAAGMAWMVRELGLPSRVAIGFTSGRSRTEGSYILTNHNAHAWTEVYFEGFGWVPFDATPRGSVTGSVNPEWAPDPNTPTERDPANPDPNEGGADPGQDDPTGADPGLGDNTDQIGGGLTPDEGSSRLLWLALGGSVLLMVLLAGPAVSRARLRRARLRRRAVPPQPADAAVLATPTGAPPGVVTSVEPDVGAQRQAHAAWDELLDTMIDFGVPLVPAESPRVTAARLVKLFRLDGTPRVTADSGEAAQLLGHAEERARYARTPLSPEGLLPAVRTIRRTLAGQSTPGTRLRAALLPPSTLLRWRHAVSEVATAAAAAMNRWSELLSRLSPTRLLRSP